MADGSLKDRNPDIAAYTELVGEIVLNSKGVKSLL